MANALLDTHPVFGPAKLKLGVFAMNCSHGCTITTAAGAHALDWPTNLASAQAADTGGFELLVPVGRWRGFGGESQFNSSTYETYTWAAAMGQATGSIGVMTTSHVGLVHPLIAAKQGATIDHISAGRYGLNIVCGWSKSEMEMFGSTMLPHDQRYDYAGEWIEIVRRAWTSTEPFDFDGKYLQVRTAVSNPKPLRTPMPPLMNAGGSIRGQRFCAQFCDIAFILLRPDDIDATAKLIADYRTLAREEFGRELKVWANGYVVQASSVAVAEALLHYYAVTNGDDVAVQNLCEELGVATVMPPAAYDRFKYHFKAGYGGFPLVGTPDTIADTLDTLSQAGLDGILLSWFDYGQGIQAWNRDVMPRLAAKGLRPV